MFGSSVKKRFKALTELKRKREEKKSKFQDLKQTRPCSVVLTRLEEDTDPEIQDLLSKAMPRQAQARGSPDSSRSPTPETDISVSSDEEDREFFDPVTAPGLFRKYLVREERHALDTEITNSGEIRYDLPPSKERPAWDENLPFERYAARAEIKERLARMGQHLAAADKNKGQHKAAADKNNQTFLKTISQEDVSQAQVQKRKFSKRGAPVVDLVSSSSSSSSSSDSSDSDDVVALENENVIPKQPDRPQEQKSKGKVYPMWNSGMPSSSKSNPTGSSSTVGEPSIEINSILLPRPVLPLKPVGGIQQQASIETALFEQSSSTATQRETSKGASSELGSKPLDLNEVIARVKANNPLPALPLPLSPQKLGKKGMKKCSSIEIALAGVTREGIKITSEDPSSSKKPKDRTVETEDIDLYENPLFQRIQKQQFKESGKEEMLRHKSPPRKEKKRGHVSRLSSPPPHSPQAPGVAAARRLVHKASQPSSPPRPPLKIPKLGRIPRHGLETTKKQQAQMELHVSPLSQILGSASKTSAKPQQSYAEAVIPNDNKGDKINEHNRSWDVGETKRGQKRKAPPDPDDENDVSAGPSTSASLDKHGRPKKRVRFAENLTEVREFVEHTPSQAAAAEPLVIDRLLPPEQAKEELVKLLCSPPPPPPPPDKITFADEQEMRILRWRPTWLLEYDGNKERSQLPPLLLDGTEASITHRLDELRDHILNVGTVSDYQKAMEPVFACHLWEQIYAQYRPRYILCVNEPHQCDFDFFQVVDDKRHFTTVQIGAIVPQYVLQAEKFELQQEGQLCRVMLDNSGGWRYFGLIKKADVRKVVQSSCPDYLQRQFMCAVETDANATMFALTLHLRMSKKEFPIGENSGTLFKLQSVAYVNRELRVARALMELSSSPLRKPVLFPDEQHFSVADGYSGGTFLSNEKRYTESELDVVRSLAEDVFCPAHGQKIRVGLVNCPPASGKNKTIIGLVEEIKRRKKQSSTGDGSILILSSTAAMVDELCMEILARNKELSEVDNKFFNFLRVGAQQNIHADVRKYSLNNLANYWAQKWRDEGFLRGQLATHERNRANCFNRSGSIILGQHHKVPECDKTIKELKRRLSKRLVGGMPKQDEIEYQERMLLKGADIIAAVLNGNETSVLKLLKQCRVLCVIVNGACQITELETLGAMGFGCFKLFLFGDGTQQPAVTSNSKWLRDVPHASSLFHRFRCAMNQKGVPWSDVERTL